MKKLRAVVHPAGPRSPTRAIFRRMHPLLAGLLLAAAALALVGTPLLAAQEDDQTQPWCTEHGGVIAITPGECQALEGLFQSTNGRHWTNNSGWLDSPDVCATWFGIECIGGRIITLQLINNGLTGSLPHGLEGLDALTSLDLTDNQIGGALPASLGSMPALAHLWLGGNEFSGAIPPALGNLSGLRSLDLGDNRLSGAIPAALGALSKLDSILFLDGNQLDGAIPGAVCALRPHIASLDFNKLDTLATPAACDSSFPGWTQTQTVPPSGLSVSVQEMRTLPGTVETSSRLLLSWLPISYSRGSGGYELFTRSTRDGAIQSHGRTTDKTTSSLQITISGDPNAYSYFVRTESDAHAGNRQALTSIDSEESRLAYAPLRPLETTAGFPLLYLPALAPLALLLLSAIAVVIIWRQRQVSESDDGLIGS